MMGERAPFPDPVVGAIFAARPAPHGPHEPCTCEGCWACSGHTMGCTCDIDWDRLGVGAGGARHRWGPEPCWCGEGPHSLDEAIALVRQAALAAADWVSVRRSDLLAVIDAHDEDGRMGRLMGGEDWAVIQRLAKAALTGSHKPGGAS